MIDIIAVNTIRMVAAEMVEKANSGHPGTPIALAPAAHVLFSEFLKCSADNPNWFNRDRFVLSNGHVSALQYVMLYLTGYIGMDDLKQFRQLGSRTPGHPEGTLTPGVEVTTGPLGQGVANGVGMALAAKHLAARLNTELFPNLIDHKIWVFCGDGCLQEGVSGEASSLAGHLGLGSLVVIYDDNNISIDGRTSLSFTENVKMRYEAYGWDVIEVTDGNTNLEGIRSAFSYAKHSTSGKPMMILLKTIIGHRTSKQDTAAAHGAPLGKDSLELFRDVVRSESGEKYHANKFDVSDDVLAHYSKVQERWSHDCAKWMSMFVEYRKSHPENAAIIDHLVNGTLPSGWDNELMKEAIADAKPNATRNYGRTIINHLAASLPHLIGGSADLTPSNRSKWKGSIDFQKSSPKGRYLRFGVREHAMFALCNGIATYGMIPFSATFLNFITYGWGAARLSALAHARQIYIMTHDSIFLGEDGPTHQPIETIPLMRATPNMQVWRPANMVECVAAYKSAVMRKHGPTVICLSRQKMGNLPRKASFPEAMSGAYRVQKVDNPQVRLIATGSEVEPSCKAAQILSEKGFRVEVISAPCVGKSNLEALVQGAPAISVEAGSTLGWAKYTQMQIGVDTFGASGNLKQMREHFGFNAEQIAAKVLRFLQSAKL